MAITKEKIAAMSPTERATLYLNAKKLSTGEGDRVVKLIEESGLPFSEGGGIRMDDPLALAMADVVQSEECKKACIKAVEEGWPAIAGVDQFLAEKFRADYGKHNMTTNLAGHLVADLMRSLGYRMVGKMGPTPKGCVARSGELWEKK